jgi:hypothetical protein
LQLVSPEIYVFIIYAYLHTKEFYSIWCLGSWNNILKFML